MVLPYSGMEWRSPHDLSALCVFNVVGGLLGYKGVIGSDVQFPYESAARSVLCQDRGSY